MFEDIENFLSKNRDKSESSGKKSTRKKSDPPPGEFKDEPEELLHEKFSELPIEIKKFLKDKGLDIKDIEISAVKIGRGALRGGFSSLDSDEQAEILREQLSRTIAKLEHVVVLFNKMCVEAGVKIVCRDKEGNELKVGDLLEHSHLGRGKHYKSVLKVGYHCVELSNSEDHSESDGTWFEDEIHEKGWTKKI